METRETATRNSGLRATGIALMVVLGAWSVPVLASSSIMVECEKDTLPTLVATSGPTTTTDVEQADEKSEATDESATEEATPRKTVTTRLPGVSDSVLPNFRRQMLRTDI